MDERRNLGLRPLLGVLAVVLVASAIWAATALAAGGSSSSNSATNDNPAAANVQNCPERDSETTSSEL